MKKISLFIVLLFFGVAFGQNHEENDIKGTINQFFDGMKNVDSAAIKNSFSHNAVMQTINSKSEVYSEDFKQFSASISKFEKGDLDERIVFESIHIDGSLASVWTPYQFFFKGKFSHCGVNNFVLVKQNGSWKIQYIIDTRRKENCK